MVPRIAVAQFDPHPGDVAGNSERMVEVIHGARQGGAEVVIFPEEAVSAYCIGDLNRNRTLIRESLRAVEARLLPASDGITVVAGFVGPESGRRLIDGAPGAHNAYAVLRDGCVLATGAKSLLVDDGVFFDTRYFLPGDEDGIVPVEIPTSQGPARMGVLICQDMWDDHASRKPARLLAKQGAHFLAVLNSSPWYVGRLHERIETARRRVEESGLPLVYVNTAGIQDNGKNVIVFDGGSFALPVGGGQAICCPQFQSGLFHLHDVERSRWQRPARIAELHAAMVWGLAGFFRRSGHAGAVIGLSGGIDSSLSAALLVEALGPENVLGLNMPTRFSSDTTRANAAELARRLGIEYIVHPIEEVVLRKREEFKAVSGEFMLPLTFENLQARERGNVLMTYAQQRGRLVVGNGNKTEFQRGYATMYGDILGALMPLGDLAKPDVYRLSEHINRVGGEPIPRAVITIPPSAELSAEQDVDAGKGDPFDYDIDGPMGREIIEFERDPAKLRELFEKRQLDPEMWAPVRSEIVVYDKLTADEFEKAAWDVFRSLENSVFKRIQAPPVLKVSRKAFGFDLRESVFANLRY